MTINTTAFKTLLTSFKGVTFATFDVETSPTKGFVVRKTGVRVMLFASRDSGYERRVNRLRKLKGLAPDFKVGPLPWGEHVNNTPLIAHNGELYVQALILKPGSASYFLGGHETSEAVAQRFIRRRPETDVLIAAYKLSSIVGARIGGYNL